MPQATNNDVTLEYETFGDPADPAVLLIMGFTAQMIAWPDELCERFVAAGRYVIRFDNRDCGLSSKTDAAPLNFLLMAAAVAEGRDIGQVPYTLSDMAADAVAVLDAAGVERAHVVGASMGGMITQVMAVEHPHRVATMTSIMSTTGDRNVGQATPDAMAALVGAPATDREGAIEASLKAARIFGGPLIDEEVVRERAGAAFDRSFHPAGAPFQMAAITKTGDRTEALRGVEHRALVIHGRADTLIAPSGGEATAEAIPNSTLLMLDEMGHSLPPLLWDQVVSAIVDHSSGEVA